MSRGPDPAEFEKAFVIEGDSEEPSRVGTPATTDEKAPSMAESHASPEGAGPANGSEKVLEVAPRPSTELPADVLAKLRKLEKLESRYQGMSTSWGPCSNF
jgi:hypothetical protein